MRYTRLTENNREMIDYVFYKSNTQPEYENLYVTTYEDGEVEYIPSTPEDNEREETRLKNLGVKFTTEIRNDLIKYIDYK